MSSRFAGEQKIAEFFGPAGVLARHLPAYQDRPGQRQMAETVYTRLHQGGQLVIEAETGIGKTLAYLIPAILSGQKIIISTATLNLQDQIFTKDIPFISGLFDRDVAVIRMKGRANYFCRYHWHQYRAQAGNSPKSRYFAETDRIEQWLSETATGDRAELSWLADYSPLWKEFGAHADRCLGSDCPEIQTCFITRLRQQAAQATLLIVNHHLFFSDLALRRFGYGEVLPRYQSIIFDEAHHLEHVASQYFGFSFSQRQLVELADDLFRQLQRHPGRSPAAISSAADSLVAAARKMDLLFPGQPGRFHLKGVIAKIAGWKQFLDDLENPLTSLSLTLNNSRDQGEWASLLRRCESLQEHIFLTLREQHDNFVYWFEKRPKNIIISGSPIEVSLEMQELYDQVKTVIFTSATLKASGDFSYLFKRLGLSGQTITLDLPTPFDYANQTLLYIPQTFPLPADAEFAEAFAADISALLLAVNGRALLLFTSTNSMQQAYDMLQSANLPFSLLIQGSAPKAALLENFRKDINSVLLAVASFWEGIDVPGKSLSCLVIDKLPFEVPTDPVIMARSEKIKEAGGNPFFDFQLPRAVLTLRQGIGRLMRSPEDRGLMAIMDVRIFSKGYGRIFRTSLPPSPITRDIEEAVTFLRRLAD